MKGLEAPHGRLIMWVWCNKDKTDAPEQEIWQVGKDVRSRSISSLLDLGLLWNSRLPARFFFTPLGVAVARHLRDLHRLELSTVALKEALEEQEELPEGWVRYPAIERDGEEDSN